MRKKIALFPKKMVFVRFADFGNFLRVKNRKIVQADTQVCGKEQKKHPHGNVLCPCGCAESDQVFAGKARV